VRRDQIVGARRCLRLALGVAGLTISWLVVIGATIGVGM